MSTVATQLPFVSEYARQVGARTFRKQILPLADVEHPRHGTLSFTRERLRRLVERFRAGVYDMVPALLADAQNRHHDDMRLARGTVTDLELGDDGLYAKIEATEEGARLLEQFPNLPVSARLANRSGGEALAHVLMTPDPVARGMGGWEPIEASLTSAATEVIDFSNGGEFVERRRFVVLDGGGEPVGVTDGLGGVELSDAETVEAERLLADLLEMSATVEEQDEREEARQLVQRWAKPEGRI